MPCVKYHENGVKRSGRSLRYPGGGGIGQMSTQVAQGRIKALFSAFPCALQKKKGFNAV